MGAVKVAVWLLVALAALLCLWLTYWGQGVSQDSLPPLRELEQPNH
jgi:hypothetical protein